MQESALFDLEGVTYSRDGSTVLESVSAQLKAPTCCVAGPSGSGKSTMLRLLSRLADPASGTIRYRGRLLADYEVLDLRRRVCLVPQLPALFEGSVAGNVEYGPSLVERSVAVEEILGLAGLDPSYANRDAERLSVGEQQRVMLARALALEPEVLLLDEPTSALDEDAKAVVEGTIRGLTERLDLSLVVVTHDLDQARRLASWVTRLEDGRIVDTGPAEKVLAR